MKKFLCALLFLCLSCGLASAEKKVGFLTKLNITEDEYHDILKEGRKTAGWQLFSPKEKEEKLVFYDSLLEMLMALNRGDINEAALPKSVAEYVLNYTTDFTVASIEQVRSISLSFGFAEGRADLRDKFNEALRTMRDDGTLSALQEKYLRDPGIEVMEPVKVDRFDGAERIRIAVTGDMPPIDLVDEADSPAGFNTAVCAEIGRRLHMNVELTDIEAGARVAALASKRVDVVFWYMSIKDIERQIDVPDNILISDAYYDWDKILYLRKK